MTGGWKLEGRDYIVIDGFTCGAISSNTSSGAAVSNIKILNNLIQNTGVGVGLKGNDVLISGNTFNNMANDMVRQFGDRWTIRNNTVIDEVDSGDVHMDFWQSWCNPAGMAAAYILIENNTFMNISGGNVHFALINDTTQCNDPTTNSIIRYNKMFNTGSIGAYIDSNNSDPGSKNNVIYNNTWMKMGEGSLPSWKDYTHNYSASADSDGVNNIFHQAMDPNTVVGFEWKSGGFQAYNFYYDPDTTITFRGLALGETGAVKNENPLLANPAANDFSLQAGSPAIDAGGPLTYVATADTGSGISLIVEKPYFFQPGWGGANPDTIAVGSVSNVAQISSINYNTNTITLATPISRNDGDSVWLYKDSDGTVVLHGTAPDIGAHEFGGETLSPPVRSGGSPSGTLPSGTTNTTLSLITNENATCRYSTTAGISYSSMTNTFSTTGGTSHSTTISGLSDGGSYSYCVRCQNDSGDVNTTDYGISFSVAVPPIMAEPDIEPPTIPSGLQASPVSSSQINLTWTASTDNVGVTGYRIYRDELELATSPTNSYPDNTGLSPSTPYTYTVSAYDAEGNKSNQSSSASATTSEASAFIEAQSGTITSPMEIVSDAEASGGAYIQTTQADSGTAVYAFNIDESGIYKIIARVYAPDGGSDSFYVKIDDGEEFIWHLNPSGNPDEFNVWREDEVNNQGTGTWDNPQYDPYTIELTQGTHTITFRGRETNCRLDYFYFSKVEERSYPDAIAPTVTITQPTSEGSYSTSQSTLTVGGSASDNIGVTSVTWINSRGGSGTASGTDSWTISSVSLQEGDNVITVTAHDAAGNSGVNTLTVTYALPDTADPIITTTSPTSGDTYSTEEDSVSLGGSASDNIGVTSVTWINSRGGSGTASGTDSWTISSVSLQEGDNVITVTAHDAAGNSGVNTLTVTYALPDTADPIITTTSPTSGDTYSNEEDSVNLGGSTSDNIGVTSVTWINSRGGSGTASGTDNWTISSVSLQEGDNVITVTAHDAAGNTGVDTLTVTYALPDTTDPIITTTSPTSEDTYSNEEDSVTLGGSASDNIGVTSVTWINSRGGSGTASGTDNWTISSVSLQEGDNVITVTAHDAAGNTGVDILTVTYTSPDMPLSYNWFQAESENITSPLETVSDPDASAGAYIWKPSRSGDTTAPDGVAEYTIDIPTTGDYVIWGRVIAPDGGCNSFFTSIDGGEDFAWGVQIGSVWTWDSVNGNGQNPLILNLAAGTHTLRISGREDGTKLDRLLITNDMAFVPSEENPDNVPPADVRNLRIE
jgi:hypothetical protein